MRMRQQYMAPLCDRQGLRDFRNPTGNFIRQFSVLLFIFACAFFWTDSVDGAVPLTASEEQVLNRFREYLRIDTAQPSPNYAQAVSFLARQGEEIGLGIKVMEFTETKPVLVLTWEGKDPSLPSVLLNSHMDVVPADASKWLHSPFAAHLDEEGRIFARGSQDMKCVSMQYLEAIRNLKAAGFRPERSLHLSYVPDEEIGGADGAQKFVKSDEFKELNVAFVLDEGIATPENRYRVFYCERTVWWFAVKASGSPAHGSRMVDGTAAHNLREALNKIDEFRTAQFEKVKSGAAVEEEVVSINNVYLKAGAPTPTGFVMNVQPSEAEAGFDMRLPPTVDTVALEKLMVEEWAPATRNLTLSFVQKHDHTNKYGGPLVTVTDDTNRWWVRLKSAIGKAGDGTKLGEPEIFFGSTDARFSRYEGIPAFGFSPLANTVPRLHDHNEFLHVKVYLRGIGVYEEIIKSLTTPDGYLQRELRDSFDQSHSEL